MPCSVLLRFFIVMKKRYYEVLLLPLCPPNIKKKMQLDPSFSRSATTRSHLPPFEAVDKYILRRLTRIKNVIIYKKRNITLSFFLFEAIDVHFYFILQLLFAFYFYSLILLMRIVIFVLTFFRVNKPVYFLRGGNSLFSRCFFSILPLF